MPVLHPTQGKRIKIDRGFMRGNNVLQGRIVMHP
jgi:hypothetical protein